MFLAKLRKDGEVEWGLFGDYERRERFDAFVAAGYAVTMVELDSSDTARLIDPELMTENE
jgi:hypothetical protein